MIRSDPPIKWRSLAYSFGMLALGALLAARLPLVFEVLELKTVDLRLVLRDRLDLNPTISPLVFNAVLDDATYRDDPGFSRDREGIAGVVERLALAKASVIGCDFLFAEYRETRGDSLLVQAFQRAGNLVPAFMAGRGGENVPFMMSAENLEQVLGIDLLPEFEARQPGPPRFDAIEACSFPELLDAALTGGFVNLLPERDGVIRRYPLVAELDGRLLPSLALAVLCAHLDCDLSKVSLSPSGEVLLPSISLPAGSPSRDLAIPLDPRGRLWLNSYGGPDLENYPLTYAAGDLLDPRYSAALSRALEGKIGIFADISTRNKDFWIAPLDPVFPSAFLHATALSNLLEEDFLTETGRVMNIFLLLLLWAGCMLLFRLFRPVAAGLCSAALLLLYLGAAGALFLTAGSILPVIPVLAPLGAALLLVLFYSLRQEERRRLVLETSMSSFLSPPLMERMIRNGSLLSTGGRRKRISVLFSDIAGFTAFCDRNEPEEVQAILDEYLGKMVGIVFRHDGIIDKYLGDGLLAFFENAEDAEDLVSPANAVATALEMRAAAQELREQWMKQNRFDLHVRVGITTGYAAVGNLGTRQKIDYTIIGSKVNLAQRLQSYVAADEIIVDRDTWVRIRDTHETEDLGEIKVKGVEAGVQAYKVL